MTASHQIAAHESWVKTVNRTARTQPARDALRNRLAAEVDPEGLMDAETKEKAVGNAISAYYRRLAQKSAASRATKAS